MSLPGYKVAVIGLGYVGLPLAALCAKKGYKVVGLDAKESVVESLNSGKCHIRDQAVERRAQARLRLAALDHAGLPGVDGEGPLRRG